MTIAYLDVKASVSGNVILAAFVSAGLPLAVIQNTVAQVPFQDPWNITAEPTMRGGISVTILTIAIPHHTTTIQPAQNRAFPRDRSYHTYSTILDQITSSNVSAQVKNTCTNLLSLLASTQAQLSAATGNDPEIPHTDAQKILIECIGIAAGIEYFGVKAIYASPLALGDHHSMGAHKVPTPANPIVLTLLKKCQIPINPTLSKLYLITPLGAAFMCNAISFDRPIMTLECAGSGGGHEELDWPNIMQIIIGSLADSISSNYVLIETNIDDMPANALTFFADKLWSAGALDVFFTAIQMKKGRPGTQLSIIANEVSEKSIAALILYETTSFGVRCVPLRKYEASRTIETVQTAYGAVRVKIKKFNGAIAGVWPEYEDCAKISAEHNIPFLDIYYSTLLEARIKFAHGAAK